jgi:hypothetical protein
MNYFIRHGLTYWQCRSVRPQAQYANWHMRVYEFVKKRCSVSEADILYINRVPRGGQGQGMLITCRVKVLRLCALSALSLANVGRLCSSSSRKVSGLTPTAVFALATPKSPIDRGGRWQLQLSLILHFLFFRHTLRHPPGQSVESNHTARAGRQSSSSFAGGFALLQAQLSAQKCTFGALLQPG